MKQITQKIIDSFNPCYPASRYYDADYKGDILQIAQDTRIPLQDRLWLILREKFVSDKLMRLFAVWCARRVVNKKAKSDVRSINALKVAARFACGKATKEELNAACDVAYSAYMAAESASNAAYAAYTTAYVAYSTVRPLARDAALIVAFEAAAQEALNADKVKDPVIPCDIAYFAAEKVQEIQLIKMIKAGIKTGDVK